LKIGAFCLRSKYVSTYNNTLLALGRRNAFVDEG
jgi:hypothetical protein